MSKTTTFQLIGYVFILILGLSSCWGGKSKHIPDVSGITVDYNIHRFEQDFFTLDTNDINEAIAALEVKYPEFTHFYLQNVLQIKKPWDTTGVYLQHIKGFLRFPFTKQLYDTTQIVYGDFSSIQQEMDQGFQFYKYYFPEKEIPTIYTFISEFTYGILFPPKENAIGIGLDLFLGAEYPYYYYPPLNLPAYIARTQDKAHLPAKVFQAIAADLVGEQKGSKFIDQIVHNGKQLYLLDHLLPYTQDSLKLGFTSAQTNWCQGNEFAMWAFFLKEELLYSNDHKKFKSLVSDSPYATGMPEEAPGKAGNWMGWQIVKSYMARFPETSLQELIDLKDSADFLNKSRYKPKN